MEPGTRMWPIAAVARKVRPSRPWSIGRPGESPSGDVVAESPAPAPVQAASSRLVEIAREEVFVAWHLDGIRSGSVPPGPLGPGVVR